MFAPSALSQVRASANILALISERVRLKRIGRTQDYIGLCCFHIEKTPSFRVHADRGFYKCFGCGKSGDAIAFLRAIDGLSFPEAVRVLAERSGVALDSVPVREYRERLAIAEGLAGECAYWVSLGGYAAVVRAAMLPTVEVEAFEWMRGNLEVEW